MESSEEKVEGHERDTEKQTSELPRQIQLAELLTLQIP